MIVRLLLLVGLVIVAARNGTTSLAHSPTSPAEVTTSALWTSPGDIGAKDLFYGPWGRESAPDPDDTYTFVRRKNDGANPGMTVDDSRGRRWRVKQARGSKGGPEGPAEVVLSRVLSAAGYHQPPVYFLPSFRLSDASGVHIEPGGRFRLDHPALVAEGHWSWDDNPFAGTRPFKGLLAILLLFNSWDLKDSNNALYRFTHGDTSGLRYVVRDLGGSLGGTGMFIVKRNDIEEFERSRFVTGVTAAGFATFAYRGKRRHLVRDRLHVDDVAWAASLLAGISDRQWRDVFRAGGYEDDLSSRFLRVIQARIGEGTGLAHSGAPQVSEGR